MEVRAKTAKIFFCVVTASMLIGALTYGQSIFATLTGVVSDPSGAVVPNATVHLRNESTGSLRDTVTNSDGYFTFASIAVGDFTYELTVEARGFTSYKAAGITLLGGDKRNVNIMLKVGPTTETVAVTAAAEQLVTVDSGEKSATLRNKALQNYVQVGSNAAEYIKIMPGFAVNNGTSNTANYDGQVIGINGNGDAGSQSPLNNAFSYNGLPGNSLDITADGAHVSDPGCNCDTPVNPNSDMVAEFKVQMSNFSAENQKGPIVASSVAKSGTNQFHGSGFFYARLCVKRQRRAEQRDSNGASAKQVLLSGRHHRRSCADSRHSFQQESRQALFFSPASSTFIRFLIPGCCAPPYRVRACCRGISRPPKSRKSALTPPLAVLRGNSTRQRERSSRGETFLSA